ncbi:unnamed protein product [Parnassius apollo]|uniref:(apollo) hypothetical protein n=1 Tax=Parnassius apollo TaxID=110799 RepID=A0A8S3YA42_PARAO|nr:unnamed protein product [Parnassius apollo]
MTQFSTSNLCVVQMTIGTRKLYIASAYVEPRDDEHATLERLDAFLKSTNDSHRIICGDFNGWHPLWGCETTNKRGREVAELIIGNYMYICNQGSIPTFETVTHGRNCSSIIDITFASGSIYEKINSWNVNLEACPLSQHNSIEFTLNLFNVNTTKRKNTSTYLYKSEKANWAEFKAVLDLKMCNNGCLDVDIPTLNTNELESFITKIISTIHEACRASMPMKNNVTQCKPIWWTDKLEKLKKDVISLHHKIHHTKRKGLALDQLLEERSRKKKEYGDELRRTSTDNFREFCERQGKENVWSVTNRLLKETKSNCSPSTLKVGNSYTNDEKETAKALLNHFYPEDSPDSNPAHEQLRKNRELFPKTNDDPPFVKEEVIECIQNMNPKRAPGCHIQAFADDVLLIAHAHDKNELEVITNQALCEIVQWGDKVKLSFSPEKTQAIAFTPKAKPTWGIQPENISIIYHQVIEPIITYAAGVWGHAAKKKSCKRLLEKTQRLFALKAIRGFRTVSTNAALALSQFMPLDLKVTEINQIENTRSSGITQYLPDDITLEKPTPIQNLLHPAVRVKIVPDSLQTSEEDPNNFTQPINIYTDGNTCPCNNHSVQNIDHLLKSCPRFGAQRMEHELHCQMLKVSPYNIQELVTKEGAIISFVKYASYIIDKLKSFNSI